jgi:hypothetical protein
MRKVNFVPQSLSEYTLYPSYRQSGEYFIGKLLLFFVRIIENTNTVGGQMQFLNFKVGDTYSNDCTSKGLNLDHTQYSDKATCWRIKELFNPHQGQEICLSLKHLTAQV